MVAFLSLTVKNILDFTFNVVNPLPIPTK